MNERSLRDLAESSLRSKISESEWDYFHDEGTIRECLHFEEPGDLITAVRRHRKHFGRPPSEETTELRSASPAGFATTDVGDISSALLRPDESRRAAVYSEYVARIAAELEGAKAIRDRLLGGSLLDATEAIVWLRSPAVALLEERRFQERCIPIVGHTATMTVQPRRIQIEPGGLMVPVPGRNSSDFQNLEYFDENGAIKTVRYAPQSPIDSLARAARELAREFGWEQAAAVRFLLCGSTPPTPPIRARYHWHRSDAVERATVSIEVEAWVSAQTVERYYRAAQKHLLNGENRPLVGRGLDILSFCLAQFDMHPEQRPSWEQLRKAWNKKHPDRPCFDRRGFAKDFRGAAKHLQWPGYRRRPPGGTAASDSQSDSQASEQNGADGGHNGRSTGE